MGSIIERKRRDGTASFRAQILIKGDGRVVHQESRSFDRRGTAAAWMNRREKELRAPGGMRAARGSARTLGDALDASVDGHLKEIGRTKAQVLRAIKAHSIASLRCEDITSDTIVEFATALAAGRQPATVGNYLSHLAAVFAVARPAWGIPLDQAAMQDAAKVCQRLGLTGKSRKRDRRPTLDELDRLMAHFQDRWTRGRAMPMHRVVAFAIFSTRRQEEIVSLRWDDYQDDHGRVLVRDMKHPGEKLGNDVWCELPVAARRIIDATPRTEGQPRIFPYSTDAVSASFTRACKLLGIDDLRFHDLRHEGVSLLFEAGRTIPQAASVSGHRSWQSLQRYSHIRPGGDKFADWAWLPRVEERAA